MHPGSQQPTTCLSHVAHLHTVSHTRAWQTGKAEPWTHHVYRSKVWHIYRFANKNRPIWAFHWHIGIRICLLIWKLLFCRINCCSVSDARIVSSQGCWGMVCVCLLEQRKTHICHVKLCFGDFSKIQMSETKQTLLNYCIFFCTFYKETLMYSTCIYLVALFLLHD